jgi:hypothetical protein
MRAPLAAFRVIARRPVAVYLSAMLKDHLGPPIGVAADAASCRICWSATASAKSVGDRLKVEACVLIVERWLSDHELDRQAAHKRPADQNHGNRAGNG